VDTPEVFADVFKFRFGYLGGSAFSTEDLNLIQRKIGY
jgi:hypothetical protein